MISPNLAKSFNVPAPVSLQLCSNRGPVQELHARLCHPLVSRFAGMFLEGPRSIRHDKYIVALFNQAQRRECDADFGENATTQ